VVEKEVVRERVELEGRGTNLRELLADTIVYEYPTLYINIKK